MKKLIVACCFLFLSSTVYSQPAEDTSLLGGFLNVVNWIDNISKSIDRITERQNLKRLSRELSYLSTDIDEITRSKRELAYLLLESDLREFQRLNDEMKLQVDDLDSALKRFDDRFRYINNNLVPAEYKVADNPMAEDINSLVSGKKYYVQGILNMLGGPITVDKKKKIQSNTDEAIILSKKIGQSINEIKYNIDKKLFP